MASQTASGTGGTHSQRGRHHRLLVEEQAMEPEPSRSLPNSGHALQVRSHLELLQLML